MKPVIEKRWGLLSAEPNRRGRYDCIAGDNGKALLFATRKEAEEDRSWNERVVRAEVSITYLDEKG